MKRKTHIWILICLLLSSICLDWIQFIFSEKIGYNGQIPAFQTIEGFYHEKKDSLDAVMFGASSVHAFWEPPLGWSDKGIAVYSYSLDGIPPKTLPFFITEVRKTQPNSLLIININNFKAMSVQDIHVHFASNYMHFSANKLRMISSLAHDAGYSGVNQLQFYLPIIRFHSRWSQLTSVDFNHTLNGLKGGLCYDPYFLNVQDVTKTYQITDRENALDQDQKNFLEELLDFLDEMKERALFIASPQSLGLDNQFYGQINQIGKMVQERGHSFLNLINMIDAMNIRTDIDFYNAPHTNVHGAIKFTEYLTDYLVENYGFTDKRGLPGWESWDKAAELYSDIIAPYTLPFEREHAARDYDLSSPVLNNIVVGDKILSLSWSRSEKAEGYDIYRKAEDPDQKNWAFVASVDEETLQYIDTGIRSGINYTYTVVPKRTVDGSVLYGNFNYSGISGKSE